MRIRQRRRKRQCKIYRNVFVDLDPPIPVGRTGTLVEAEKAGLVAASLEIRLAVGLIEVEWGDAATGSQTLEAVRQEAMARGFRGLTQRSSGPAADAFARSGAGREL